MNIEIYRVHPDLHFPQEAWQWCGGNFLPIVIWTKIILNQASQHWHEFSILHEKSITSYSAFDI